MTEVGVAIALRRQNPLLRNVDKKKAMKRKEKNSEKMPAEKSISKKKPSDSSWQVFLEVAALYAICLVLPSLLGAMVGWYKRGWDDDGLFHRSTMYVCSFPWISSTRWCKAEIAASSNIDAGVTSLTDALAPDAGISDLGIVVVLSLSMALVRLVLVYFLVPSCLKQPKRLEALVRCKSIHLLSSSYPKTVTPRPSMVGLSYDDTDEHIKLPPMPMLANMKGKTETASTASTSQEIDLQPSTEPLLSPQEQWNDAGEPEKPRASSEDWLLIDEDENVEPAPAVSSGLLTSTSAQSLQALLQQATTAAPSSADTDSSNQNESDRLFAAPKYATAVFRLVYCTACCTIALLYFVDAEFWPPAVGGKGDTKHCWDLSSVGAVVMDSDFDQRNTVLRHYFLVQASYHFHSAPFHILTSLSLWLVSATSKNKEKSTSPKLFGVIPAGMITADNIKTGIQHCFAVGLIAATYLFSSTRRLMAIGMFAFDLSSWFLHLLQLCINAQKQSSAKWIRMLHRGLVIPTFCYSRFYVFPFVLGYSALIESQDWLQQLENMFVPGSKLGIQVLFVVWLCLLMVMNFIYIRRLLYHPHVVQALNNE